MNNNERPAGAEAQQGTDADETTSTPTCSNTLVSSSADDYLAANIVEARTDFDKACDVYRNYVGKAETQEERMRRIRNFRSGGW